MTHSALLSTLFGKRRLFLYEITYNGTTYRRAAALTDKTYSAQTWTASAISHSRFNITSALGRQETLMTLPRTDALAVAVLEDDVADTSVIIRDVFIEDAADELEVIFRGRIIGTNPGRLSVGLVCEDDYTNLRHKGLPDVMQRPCRHGIYSDNCGADFDTHKVAGTITALTGNDATISIASSRSDGVYSGGILKWSGIEQLIKRHAGTTIKLVAPIVGLAAAQAGGNQSVDIAPGCRQTRAWCESEFSNLDNHGGFPWITETPFDGRTLY